MKNYCLIGSAFNTIRYRKSMTLMEVGEKSGHCHQTVQKVESGHFFNGRELRAHKRIKFMMMLEAMDCRLDELMKEVWVG